MIKIIFYLLSFVQKTTFLTLNCLAIPGLNRGFAGEGVAVAPYPKFLFDKSSLFGIIKKCWSF